MLNQKISEHSHPLNRKSQSRENHQKLIAKLLGIPYQKFVQFVNGDLPLTEDVEANLNELLKNSEKKEGCKNSCNCERKQEKRSGTPQEINEIYGLDVGTLANLRSQKRGIEYFKVGKRVYYFLTDVEAWLRRNPVLTLDCEEVRHD